MNDTIKDVGDVKCDLNSDKAIDLAEKNQIYEHFRGAFLLLACAEASLDNFEHTMELIRSMPKYKDNKTVTTLLTEHNRKLALKVLTIDILFNFIFFPKEAFFDNMDEDLRQKVESQFLKIVHIERDDNPARSESRLLNRFRNSIAHARYYLTGNDEDSLFRFVDVNNKGKDLLCCSISLPCLDEYLRWFINEVILPVVKTIDEEFRSRGFIIDSLAENEHSD